MEPYEILESQWAHYHAADARDMVACSSGTAALHLALESLELPPGSHVLIPDYTMIACARAVTLAGLEPVFASCEDDLLVSVRTLDTAVTHETRAAMPVHVYGRRCNMDAISDWAARRGILVVEDMAEAHGVAPHPATAAACWSFYRNKIVHGEEGGAVLFRWREHASKARQLRCLGFTDEHDFMHVPRGMNYRMANALATPILESLMLLNQNLAKRAQVAEWYGECIPGDWKMPRRDVTWVYDVRIRGLSSSEQDNLVRTLNERGVAARHGFKPMSMQEEYGTRYPSNRSTALAREVVYFPVTPDMTRENVQRIAREVKSILGICA